jgi:hypothetical protein
VEFDREPQEADMEEAVAALDAEGVGQPMSDPSPSSSLPPQRTPEQIAEQARLAELQAMPDPQVSEAQFIPAEDGTLSLRDNNGNTYVPHNDQLLRSVRMNEQGQVEVLLRNLKRPGQVIKLTGQQAEQAQDAILAAAINVEQQGGTVRYGTSRGLQNLQGGNRSNAGSTTLPSAAADALVNLASAAVRAGQTFAQWATSMLQRFGEAVRQYLQGAWQAAMRTSEVGAINPQGTGKRGGLLQRTKSQTKAGRTVGTSNPTAAQRTGEGTDANHNVELSRLRENNPEAYRKNALLLTRYPLVAREQPALAGRMREIDQPLEKAQAVVDAANAELTRAKYAVQKAVGEVLKKKTAKVKAAEVDAFLEANPGKRLTGAVRKQQKLVAGLTDKLEQAKKNQALALKGLLSSQSAVTLEKADAIYESYITAVESNLETLINLFPKRLRDIARLWYDGANIIAQNFGRRFGATLEQASAVLAVFSPQKDWFMNVSLAERMMGIWKNDQDTAWSKAMSEQYIMRSGEPQPMEDKKTGEIVYDQSLVDEWNPEGIKYQRGARPGPPDENGNTVWINWDNAKAESSVIEARKLLSALEGKTLRDIVEPRHKARFIRMLSEVKDSPHYAKVSPDGQFGGLMTNDKGVRIKVAWGGYNTIEKAISIMEATTENEHATISEALGEQHKVRSFYNNIADPANTSGHVTMDTHAVAALLWLPLSGASVEVTQNFGGAGVQNDGGAGIKGMYAANAEAYRRAGLAFGLLPREVQSITWEAVRLLFPAKWKSSKANVAKVRAVWERYLNHELSIEQARAAVFEIAAEGRNLDRAIKDGSGVGNPSWAEEMGDSASDPAGSGNANDTGELSASRRTSGQGSGRGAGGLGSERGGRDRAAMVSPTPTGGLSGFKNLNVNGTTAGFANAQILAEAADLIRQGFNTFATWSRAMLTRFGRGIKAHLEAIWERVKPAAAEMLMNYMRRTGSLKDLFAGEKAIIPPFMRDSLATAKAMAAAGKDAETIRTVTGWFPGKYDGKMRWEVPDEGAEIGKAFGMDAQDRDEITAPLAQVLWHDALYKAYPEARTMKVQWKRGQAFQRSGSFNHSDQTIKVEADTLKDALSVILHEVQHWIQQQEGFAQGSSSNASDFTKPLTAEIKRLKAIGTPEAKASARKLDSERMDLYLSPDKVASAYRRTAGEIESRDIQARRSLTAEQRKATAPYSSENIAAEDAIVLMEQDGPQMSVELPEGMAETRSRFASPNQADNLYEVQSNEVMQQQATAWLDSNGLDAALAAMEANQPPPGLRIDHLPALSETVLQRLTTATTTGTETQRLMAETQLDRAGRAWQGIMSQEAGRTLQQRAAANARLLPIAPILAAKQVLVDRADAVMNQRFEGGAEGAVEKVKDIEAKAGTEAGTEVAADLDAETEPDTPAATDPQTGKRVPPKPKNPRKGAARAKHPALKKMLDALRKKLYPVMSWADIFMDLPSTQKDRQREIYRRLKLDQRLQGLTQQERLDLTNELDKAWQRERRKVFNRELKKAGVIGEKDAADRQKVEKALPKLLRMINLGMFNSAMWREAVAPEYGLKMLTSADTANLRTLAEAAWKLPEGVLRNQKLRDLLNALQKTTGASWIEVLNSYWTAAVLSGLRTQFDTWMSAINGMGTNLIQIGTLLARGQGRAAISAHAQWWRGLLEGVRESGQILWRGDTSYLKRFGADLMKALEGETSVTPVPLGENLWNNGNKWQKYGLAPVMMFTGRLMAAADHINNTATTQGAMAVARALHPELYEGRSGFTDAERANARAQALREITGGREPQTSAERATVSARARELLNGNVGKQDYAAASEIGDMAAFQNDPTGIFGIVYSAMKQGLGSIQRGLGDVAEDVTANRYARVATGIMAGSLHGITGTRFMRFGFNFGAELTRYIPGSYVLGRAGFYGRDVSRMQQELLLGKNLVGLMIGSTLAALFLDGDDDEEGWQIEGDWSTLTPQEAKARMSAGLERMTMWKRENGQVKRVSYKQWPTMGLFSVVGGMLDKKRHKPAQWATHGAAGHLLRGLATGYVQIKNVSAVRNLVELFGEPSFAADPITGTIDKIIKTSGNFAGGFVPTLVKDAEIWADPRNYKPEGVAEQLLRSMPIARRYVNDGRPQLNLLGEEVQLQRAPWSRAYTSVESAEAHRVLGALMARGLTLPIPSDQIHVFKDGVKVPLESLGREAVWKYERAVGRGYKDWLSLEGSDLLKMSTKQADAVIQRRANAIKMRAKAQVVK